MRLTRVNPDTFKGSGADPVANLADPTPWPNKQPVSTRDELIEMGIHPDQVDAIDGMINRNALVLAGEMIRHLLRKLRGCAAGMALQRVVLSPENSLRDDAATAGCSAPNLLKLENKIKGRLANQ
jgi:methyl coenzyme M reductase subunit C